MVKGPIIQGSQSIASLNPGPGSGRTVVCGDSVLFSAIQ